MFLGDLNSGKISIINSFIACVTNKNDNVKLPTNKKENTYYPTIVERSKDKFYYMMKIEYDKQNEPEKFSKADDINLKLMEIDKNSGNYLNELQKSRREENDSTTIFHYIIQIPDFPSDLRLIDCPGMTNQIIVERIFKLINEKYILYFFIYLRSFTQSNVTENDGIFEFFNKIEKSNQNSIFCICLTKYDLFVIDDLKGSDYYNPDIDPKEKKNKNYDLHKTLEILTFFKKK